MSVTPYDPLAALLTQGYVADGEGVLSGDLTPECAAVVRTVLEALSAPAGAEDARSHEQRYHDALGRRGSLAGVAAYESPASLAKPIMTGCARSECCR
jgi:hypothetical protein